MLNESRMRVLWDALLEEEYMPSWLRLARPSIGVAVLAALITGPAQATTISLNARQICKVSVTSNITLSPDGAALELRSGEVFQDDGPASGFSYKPNQETLSPGIEIRKQLLIRDPQASKALLMVGGDGDLKIEVNGHPQKLGAPQKIYYGQWQAYNIDPAALRPGVNDIVISGTGMIRIARADDSYVELPHRSARSANGGKSWTVDGLGPAGDIAGEYYVRVSLEHFVSSGSILLPVMDVANLKENPLAPPLTAPGPLRISVFTAPDSGQGLTLRVRSGMTYVPSPKTWSEWVPLDHNAILKTLRGRFVQVEVTLATTDPLVTPRLSKVTLTTEPQLAKDWTKAIKVVDFHNEEIVRTSIPFRYEPFTQPKLKELRTRYRLDDVIRGAKTELDIITRLAAWSSRQWKWGDWHLDEFYPPWDACEILKRLPDGKPVGGFCQQYDLVFLQACESFGFVGRDISISSGTLGRPTIVGHEPVEIWSNQFRKWIWIDGTSAYYAEDSATRIPLSLWEVRQRQLRVLRGQPVKSTRIVHIVDTIHQWRGLDVDMSFAELRLIPRSNFLEQKWPLPLNNGKYGWTWSGFYVWTDADVPAEPIYPHLVTRQGNFEWTLDQAHFVLEPTSTPGDFLVHLDTETPGFATFMAEVDNGEKSPVAAIFPWNLHAGHNHLRVWPRNNAGRDGIASWIDLEMPERR
jgi:hypothetical protein